jgi:hypothetical protein
MARKKTGAPVQEKVVSFRLFPEEFRALDELRRQEGKTRSEMFRAMLSEHLRSQGIEIILRKRGEISP